jgi:2-oxo-hept-3-ene-1,7-dioate hydratase
MLVDETAWQRGPAMTRTVETVMTLAAIAMAAGPALAACPGDAEIEALTEAMLSATPAATPEVESVEDGLCAQEKLVARLSDAWGPPVGYKAGLTSAAAQEAFGVSEPVRGRLLDGMMLEEGATVDATFGTVPRFEADLIVVIGDASVNEAASPEEVLAAIDAIHPFIELPDLYVADPRTLDGPSITAINVGARHGVLGPAIDPGGADMLSALADMTVRIVDAEGRELSAAPGSAVLGHPLNAVLWLRDSGVTFAEGDLVSVGSIGPLHEPQAGMTATATYEGLPGDPSLSVTFR